MSSSKMRGSFLCSWTGEGTVGLTGEYLEESGPSHSIRSVGAYEEGPNSDF